VHLRWVNSGGSAINILHNRDATGGISMWVGELGALSMDFKPRTTMKSQALVDLMAEW
jgi:hypothetical protein